MAYPQNHAKMSVRYTDYDGEPSVATFRSELKTAANFDAQAALELALRTALEGVTRGLRVGFTSGNDYQTVAPSTRADDVFAQRENKWLVEYGNANKTHRLEVPCADLEALDPDNRGYMLLSSGDGAAFKSAFEDLVLDEDGNAVEVFTVKFVGKNI